MSASQKTASQTPIEKRAQVKRQLQSRSQALGEERRSNANEKESNSYERLRSLSAQSAQSPWQTDGGFAVDAGAPLRLTCG
jgi:hypothetical protein